MAQVYMFPEQKKLPKHIEDGIRRNAKEYMGLLYGSLMLLGEGGLNQMEHGEIVALVTETYLDGLNDAIDEMDES
jgi:hypothetical protein